VSSESGVRERTGISAVLVTVIVLVLLIGGGYAYAARYAGDRVPKGHHVAGVDVGGQARDEAVASLRKAMAGVVSTPITVEVDGQQSEVDAADAGLSIDYEASVDRAVARESWNPADVWEFYIGGSDVEPVVNVDDVALGKLIDRLQADLGTAPRNGKVRFVNGSVRVVEPRNGRGIDPQRAAEELTDAWLAGEPAVLDITDLTPDIDADDVDLAVDEFANPALVGPVILRFGGARVKLSPSQYAKALSLEPQDGVLEPVVDTKVLARLVKNGTAGEGAPQDARIVLKNGKPKVIPAKPGVTFRPDDIGEVFLDLVTRPEGERDVEVEGTATQPDFTTKDARRLNIKEKVSEFVTYYPPTSYRDTNIGRAAELIDGTILKPGETFSLNGTLGERTAENGFTTGGVIENGIFTQAYGGGVSQMATTMFNAMFFAGLEDIEHKPHSVYISRYPEGREATVNWGTLDMSFKNDTPHGILIHAFIVPSAGRPQGEVHVEMYSTKVWDIEAKASGRYAYVSPKTRVLTTPDCTPQTGYDGFQVDVTRVFRKHGEKKVDHTEDFHTSYIASDTVVCKKPGSDKSN